ncbi:uncharacterized protein V1513DRAFT_444701 [Lipomyces chichibuensis]|uniref:uncharacterized protein n=1 Tax=Lipomyces chichibuensis TaxID=1546026 RepID=UPI003342F50F
MTMPEISPEATAKANDLKAKGNTAFGKKDFKTALEYYTQAIKTNPTEPIFLSNRAACHLQLENWVAAETDCNLALVMIGQLVNDNVPNPKAGVKLFYRRGVSRRAQGKLMQAKADWERALKLDPDNKSVKEDLNAMAWELKKQERNSRGTTKQSVKTTPSAKPSTQQVTTTPTTTTESITAKRTNIPIQIVDSLPKEFVFTEVSGPAPATTHNNLRTTSPPKPVPSAAPVAPQSSTSQRSQSPTIPVPSAALASSTRTSSNISRPQIAIPKSFPRTPNLYDLTQLIRRPSSERLEVLTYFFNNIPPQQLPSIFGRGGIEGAFIEMFLDAIVVLGEDLEHTREDEFVERSTQLLKGIAACDRFSIAKVFLDDKKVVKAFSVCDNIALDCGENAGKKVTEVRRIWKSM